MKINTLFSLKFSLKQGWRLMQNKDAIWAKVLKGLYFPNSSFLEARKGARASWCWNSLLEGSD